MRDIEKEFLKACSNGNIEIIEYILKEINENIDIRMYDELPFRIACKNGQFETVKYLIKYNSNIDITIKNNHAFLIACSNQDIELVEYLISLKPDIINNKYLDTELKITEYAFITACKNDNISIAKWLLKLDSNINTHVLNEMPLERACYGGCIEIVNWLLNMENRDIKYINEIFIITCIIGYTEIGEVLLSYYPSILNENSIKDILTYACKKGKISLGKWLYKLIKDNVKYFDYSIYFLIACKNNHINYIKIMVNELEDDFNYYEGFYIACVTGYYELALLLINISDEIYDNIDNALYDEISNEEIKKWLLTIKPEIVNKKNNNCFIFY